MERLFYASGRYAADLAALIVVLAIQAFGAWLLWRRSSSRSARRAIVTGMLVSYAVLGFGFLLRFDRIGEHFSPWWPSWGRGLAVMWGFLSVLWSGALLISRWCLTVREAHSSGRRSFLRVARAVVFCGPAAAVGYGVFIERLDLRLREQKLVFPDLPKDLDGLRLVQLSDIHLSPFLSERELAHAVDMANETRAHIALVTGDLITSGGDPVDACLGQLARLRTDAGVFGCMGNHEIYANVEKYVQQAGARLGMN
ncbi:MAG: metallophosphoesterase, partial [Bryobacteraceae bacterium]